MRVKKSAVKGHGLVVGDCAAGIKPLSLTQSAETPIRLEGGKRRVWEVPCQSQIPTHDSGYWNHSLFSTIEERDVSHRESTTWISDVCYTIGRHFKGLSHSLNVKNIQAVICRETAGMFSSLLSFTTLNSEYECSICPTRSALCDIFVLICQFTQKAT